MQKYAQTSAPVVALLKAHHVENRLKISSVNNVEKKCHGLFRGYLSAALRCATATRAACARSFVRLLGGCAQPVRPWLMIHGHIGAKNIHPEKTQRRGQLCGLH